MQFNADIRVERSIDKEPRLVGSLYVGGRPLGSTYARMLEDKEVIASELAVLLQEEIETRL